jgi:hypothetical protein
MKKHGTFEEIKRVKVTCGECGKTATYQDIHKARALRWQIEWRPKPFIFCPEHICP